MKVAAITRFKHGSIFELLKELGWSQKELARQSGIPYTKICGILNLLFRPSEDNIIKLEIAFGRAGKVVDIASFFPDSYIGFTRPLSIVQVQDVEPKQLEYFRQHQTQLLEDAQVPIPSEMLDSEDKLKHIFQMLDGTKGNLDERERRIIRLHLLENESFDLIAKEFGVTGSRIQTIFKGSLYKIRDYFDRDVPK